MARVLGFCVQHINPAEKLGNLTTKWRLQICFNLGSDLSCPNRLTLFTDSKISSSSGVVLIKEAGLPVNMEHMKMLTWEERVQVKAMCSHLFRLEVNRFKTGTKFYYRHVMVSHRLSSFWLLYHWGVCY